MLCPEERRDIAICYGSGDESVEFRNDGCEFFEGAFVDGAFQATFETCCLVCVNCRCGGWEEVGADVGSCLDDVFDGVKAVCFVRNNELESAGRH